MPGVLSLGGSPASATGLTGLDAVTGYSVAYWLHYGYGNTLGIFSHANQANWTLDGVTVLVTGDPWWGLRAGDAGASSATYLADSRYMRRAANQWHHYAVTWDQSVTGRVMFWIDAVLVGSGALTRAPTAGGTRLTQFASSSAFQGRLFDLQVFPNVVLTAGEVRATMDPRKVVGGCKGRWFRNWRPLASGLLVDESGNANNLTLSAAATYAMQCEEPPWREAVGAR